MTDVPGRRQNFVEWVVAEPVRVPREHHRAAAGQTHVLVLRHDLHLHPRQQLDRPAARRRHDRLGIADRARLHGRPAAVSRRQRRSEHDAGDVAGVLRLLDRVGASGSRSARHRQRAVRAEGRVRRGDAGADAGRVLRRGCLEIVSILFRPVSLSFRLYGNVSRARTCSRRWRRWSRARVAAADPVLLHGTAGRSGAGDGVHAADGGLHAAHLPAPRGDRRRPTPTGERRC